MEITDVTATAHEVAVDPLVGETNRPFPFAFVRIETSDGTTGYGETGFHPAGTVAAHVNGELADRLVGLDPFDTERVRDTAIRDERVPPGLQSAALSAIDVALWDVRGKALDEPVWRLLGGSEPAVDVYVTIGTPIDDPDALANAAERVVSAYGPALKIVAGHGDDATPAEDAERVKAVRGAIGDRATLAVDVNASYGIDRALELAHRIEDHDVAWLEEPIQANDAASLSSLRERTAIPIVAGQFSGHRSQHWEFVRSGAVDACQPNVCFVGGFTEGRKVAAMAETANLDLIHAGGWPFQNIHLVGGAANGRLLEAHSVSWAVGEHVYEETPTIADGTVVLPDRPGTGLAPDESVLSETRLE